MTVKNDLVEFMNENDNEKEINAIIDNEFGGKVTPRELMQIAIRVKGAAKVEEPADKVKETFKRMREDRIKNTTAKKQRNRVFNEILKEQIAPERFEKEDEMDSKEDAERNRDQEGE